jgi:hypothetical protein
MAFVATDWSITRSTGNIRYVGDLHGGASPSYATVIELHRALQDFADNATSSGDDQLDITDANPSQRSTDNIITLINGYNIDDASAEYLYDGSIVQAGGDEIYDGVVNFGNTATIQVVQNGAVLTNDYWNQTAHKAATGDAAAGISHRFLVKVRNGGSDIDGRRLIGLSRTYGNTYSEFSINGSTRGNNVLALSEGTDLNNGTASGTVAGYTSIVFTEGYQQIDITGDGVDEDYYVQWDKGTQTINDTYERVKYLTRDGTSDTLFGLNGLLFRGITHEIDLSGTSSGTFDAAGFEPVSWTGGTGQMLAVDNATAGSATKMWIQLLTGTAPSSGTLITAGTSGATVTTTGSATERDVPTASVLGVSTGSAIIGAFGVGFDPNDVTANDDFTDLTGTLREPPNNVTFTVSGVVATEDTILVAPSTGAQSTTIDTAQLSLNTTLSGATETSVVVTTAIPSDTPSSGTIRIQTDAGLYRRVAYTSFSGSTFTIASTDFSTDNATAANNVFISYIDKVASATSETFTVVYNADRELVVKVRDGGATPIVEFLSPATLGSGGGSSAAIRTSDA